MDHHFPFSEQHLRALKGPLSDWNLGGKGWHVDMLLGILELGLWPWSQSRNTHTDKLSHPNKTLPSCLLSRGSNRWQVLAEGGSCVNKSSCRATPLPRTQTVRGAACCCRPCAFKPIWGLKKKSFVIFFYCSIIFVPKPLLPALDYC